MIRALKFYTVGAAGAAVQLAFLVLLKGVFRLDYFRSTALAVEAAVLHNFFWHQRWTWRDRKAGAPGPLPVLGRLLRFNLTTGLVSIASNLLLMRFFVGELRLHYLPANMLTILTASLANLLFSEFLVFRPRRE